MKRFAWVLAWLVTGVGAVAQDGGLDPPPVPPAARMTVTQAVVLGVVEGLTEYLPVSSTGHLKIAQRAMGLEKTVEAKRLADAYAIAIQAGAILAVLGLYFAWVRRMALGLIGRDREGLRLVGRLSASFLPAAGIGIALNDPIKAVLFRPWPVVAAWAMGGLGLFALEAWRRRQPEDQGRDMLSLSVRGAFLIGLMQCVAMWPGVSRSLMAIVGGLLLGLRMRDAVVYSFLLGLVTLGAATAYDSLKHGADLVAAYGPASLLAGFAAAAVSAALAVRWMVDWLSNHGLGVFAWYRLALAAVVAGLLVTGRLSF